jgi:hypothetical protein
MGFAPMWRYGWSAVPFQQCSALHMMRHREQVEAAERGRDPLRPTAIIGPKPPLTCGDADFFT